MRFQTSERGLTRAEARHRLARYGPNLLKPRGEFSSVALLLAQFKSPIVLILLCAAGLSAFLGQRTDTLIILAIVLGSGLLGFWQERGAAGAVEALLARVRIKAEVLRDGKESEIAAEDVVPGDIVKLSAGDIVPSDCLVLESHDLYLNEATLTGETYPVAKAPGALPEDTPLGRRKNSLFMGTHVVSGSGTALVVSTGSATEFGHVSQRLSLGRPETEFEHGVRRFGYFLMEVTLMLVIAIFAVNVYLKRPVLDSFLFSLALAVGLTPQLLPVIISVNLAHGARRMAKRKVIVKRLASIENFGSMNVLCSDKTGTLTEGVVQLKCALDCEGNSSDRVFLHAYINASFESGFVNPIDEAIRKFRKADLSGYQKLDEVPYDFIRKRLSILVAQGSRHLMVTKGAIPNVLEICARAESSDGRVVDLAAARPQIEQHQRDFGTQGYRTLGVAYRDLGSDSSLKKDHEREMTFLGFLVLHDPPKREIAATVRKLRDLGVALKIVTGDHHLVAATVGKLVGLDHPHVLTGPAISRMSAEALVQHVGDVEVFAEIEPNQKERILLALKKAGSVVGFVGDGINDAAALHTADVGISVDTAVDVAKDAADIVLLEKDLDVLVEGVREGRTTFANTLKYVFIATSANFGNMFSMAGLSLFLPFLPLLPKQILLNNLLTDLPEMAIATDSVDREMIEKPRRWNIKFIRDFMIVFGSISSVFDFATFGLLLFVLHATRDQFRTGWFLESVISATVIVFVVRTRRPFLVSRPGRSLAFCTVAVGCVTLLLPYTPIGSLMGFRALPGVFFLGLGSIVAVYIAAAEAAKRFFYRSKEPGAPSLRSSRVDRELN